MNNDFINQDIQDIIIERDGYKEQVEEKGKEIDRLNNIISELEKWLKEKQILYGINQQGFSWGVCGDALDKLNKLKEKE